MICEKVGSRELFTLDGDGVLLRGTYHKTNGSAANSGSGTGVVFLGALAGPRSMTADSAVFWANAFADCGYPSFRIDLPGIGDSYGEIPNDLLEFVNDGGYASITAAKVKELVQTFDLSGVVMFGHCAGATNAIYSASEGRECRGLILMDPYFNLPKSLTSKISPELVHWARRSPLGAVIRATYDRLREFPGALRTDELPADANVAFMARWKKVVSSGIPILILKSPQAAALGSQKLRSGGFDYLAFITSFTVRSDQFTIKTLEETDHSFANRLGRLAVQHHTEAWLHDYFPHTHTHISSFARPETAVNRNKSRDVSHAGSGLRFVGRSGSNMIASNFRDEITTQFRLVAREQDKRLASLTDDLPLLDSGLDSLCFAILVTRLEDALGVDPFTTSEDASFPVTLGDFINFYENAAT